MGVETTNGDERMGYVIKCHGNGRFDGWYVNAHPDPHSYTPDIRKAKRYTSQDAAKADACGNESVHSVESQLSGTC